MSAEDAAAERTFSVSFPEESGHRASAAAGALADALMDIDPSLVMRRDRDNPNTQDAGAILTIVLGSAPAIAVAAGIAAWIRMRRLVVRIKSDDRSIEVSGSGTDAAHVIESIFKRS